MLILETENLELHQLTESHRVQFFDLLSNPELLHYVSDTPSVEEIELQFQSRLEPWNIESQHWFTLSILEKSSGNFVGINGFKIQQGRAAVGFVLLPNYHGLGYATESLRAVCKIARDFGITELNAYITKGNIASVKVVEKCGFVFVNEAVAAVKIAGKAHNDLEYRRSLNQNT